MKNPLFLCFFAAFFFGSWPIIAKTVQLSPIWLSILVSSGTILVAMFGITEVPTSGIIAGLLCGIINGIGMHTYRRVINETEISRYVPIISASMFIIMAVEGFIFLGEPMTIKKILGFIAIAAGIFMLN